MKVAKPSSSLVALKPRQVILFSSSNSAMENKASATQSLNPHQKSLLLLSVAHFLERNSFSKTLKKFLSEAKIQINDAISPSLDLEDMCCKYFSMSDLPSSNLNTERVQDMLVDGVTSAAETATKKKKKRGNESSTNAIACESEVDKNANSKKSGEQVLHEASKEPADDIKGGSQLGESAKKAKEKKKKSKLESESHVNNVECNPSESLGGESEKNSKDAVSTENNSVSNAGIKDKTKDKKTSKSRKNKTKDDSEDIEKGKSSNTESKDNNHKISKEESTITDSKGAKKRKRLESEEHNSQHFEEHATADSKRMKTESSRDQGKNGKSEEVGVNDFQKKTDKQLHELENGKIEENGNNSEKKSLKQQNGSAQPKKPFQRVNVDEVEFVDSRLEDNSYWAKGGAETGYGAKAQEVLGQVRGRGFRHEKTKKKRGSYRGGQIDLQSHSIKFNYSDEE